MTKSSQWVAMSGSALLCLLLFHSCSTTELRPEPAPVMTVPPYVKVPHPAGSELTEVVALFIDPTAPRLGSLFDCDGDFRRLRERTASLDEVKRGARELVRRDPVFYHWCFYGKIVQLENSLKDTPYVDERQKKVVDAYAFLAPVARGFLTEFQDSRYLRWAIRHYRRLNEWVFFRKLNQTEKTTQELVEATNPFGLYKEASPEEGSVLEKYHVLSPQGGANPVAPMPNPNSPAVPETSEGGAERYPATVPSDLPEAPSGAVSPSPLPTSFDQLPPWPENGQETSITP